MDDALNVLPLVQNNLDISSVYANDFYPNISFDNFGDDELLCATARALLKPRIGENMFKGSIFTFDTKTSPTSFYKAWEASGVKDGLYDTTSDACFIINMSTDKWTPENYPEVKAKIEKKLCPKGFVFNETSSLFFSRAKSREEVTNFVYQNSERRMAVLFISQLDVRFVHILAASMSKFLKWYFVEQPTTEEERQYLYAIVHGEEITVKQFLQNACAMYDIAKIKTFHQVANAFKAYTGTLIKQLQAEIIDQENTIQTWIQKINDIQASIESKTVMMCGYQSSSIENNTLAKVFVDSKEIFYIGMYNNSIEYEVGTYLQNWNQREIEKIICNCADHFYARPRELDFTNEIISRVYNDLFVNDNVRLYVRACFGLQLNGGMMYLDHNSIHGATNPKFANYLRHPHLEQFHCPGGNKDIIRTLVSDHKYEIAVAQTIAATTNYNFLDGAVSSVFTDWFWGQPNLKCLQTKDGTMISLNELIESYGKEVTVDGSTVESNA